MHLAGLADWQTGWAAIIGDPLENLFDELEVKGYPQSVMQTSKTSSRESCAPYLASSNLVPSKWLRFRQGPHNYCIIRPNGQNSLIPKPLITRKSCVLAFNRHPRLASKCMTLENLMPVNHSQPPPTLDASQQPRPHKLTHRHQRQRIGQFWARPSPFTCPWPQDEEVSVDLGDFTRSFHATPWSL